MIEQEPFEFTNVFERPAIREDARGIYRQSIVEGERLTRKSDAGFRPDILGKCAIAVTPAAHNIEAFKREPGRIDLTVTGSASSIGPMTIELLADRDSPSYIRFEGGHTAGRGGVEAEDAFHDPNATKHRRGGGAVSSNLEDACLCHDSTANRLFRERDFAHSDARNA